MANKKLETERILRVDYTDAEREPHEKVEVEQMTDADKQADLPNLA